jgi:hypothetical protein
MVKLRWSTCFAKGMPLDEGKNRDVRADFAVFTAFPTGHELLVVARQTCHSRHTQHPNTPGHLQLSNALRGRQ